MIDQVDALVDAGLDELIFNLPFADPATVRRAGELPSRSDESASAVAPSGGASADGAGRQ